MSYLGFRDGLVLFDKSGCPPGELGAALRRELDPAGRKTLLRLLPRRISRRVQQALGP
jgi:hypothetical protein